MAVTRACSIALLVMAACADAAPTVDLGEVESEVSSPSGQGVYYQGVYYQGVYYQGVYYQGVYYQSSSYQGASSDGLPLSNGSVSGTALVVWTPLGSTLWMQRFPDKYCLWNSTKTTNYGCTAQTEPSPLAGVQFQATFVDPEDGSTFQGHVRIGSDSGTTGAVVKDSSVAMHPLLGNASADAANAALVPCDHPQKCRVNSDLWLYKLKLVEPDGNLYDFCPGGELAYAIGGRYGASGSYTTDSTRFTFACKSGTIAKCTMWGYRPFGSAKKYCNPGRCTAQDPALYSLVNYHRSCIRAAMADYCAAGHSFTKNGTLVDLWDWRWDREVPGFVPRTTGLIAEQMTAFELESGWDRYGAHQIDHLRYEELSYDPATNTLGTIDDVCPSTFNAGDGSGDVLPDYFRDSLGPQNPTIWIDSTTACSHSERTIGKWLHPRCGTCIVKNASMIPSYCTDPQDPRGWDSTCVARANTYCTGAAELPMTSHGECTTGAGLPKYATGCTLRVCNDYPGCCGPTGSWTSTCVNAAKSLCKGGQETAGRFANFCSGGILPPAPGASTL
jgi:hypothetical protein